MLQQMKQLMRTRGENSHITLLSSSLFKQAISYHVSRSLNLLQLNMPSSTQQFTKFSNRLLELEKNRIVTITNTLDDVKAISFNNGKSRAIDPSQSQTHKKRM